MKRGAGQSVLVCPPIDVGAGQLFRRCISDGSHRDIGLGDPADVTEVASYAEVRQQDSAFPVIGMGEQDVGGFDVAVQQAAIVGVIESTRDRVDDVANLID